MTLALENRTIPPNIRFETPNPKSKYRVIWCIFVLFLTRNVVPFEKCKLKVPVEPMAWPEGRADRVGVNSFGIGGSNAFVSIKSSRLF
jgi:acyl transferase domain-containing protein